MSETGDAPQTTPAGNGDEFDPQAASALLEGATRRARRGFQPNPPSLAALAGVALLAAYGGIWLSVRGQHPYSGPSGWAIALTYVLVALVAGWSALAAKRAAAGVSGPAQRARNAGIGVLLVAWASVYVFQGALYHAGASHAIVYGLYPATAPLMVLGLVAAASAAGRADWPTTGTALAVAVIAAGAAFGGPAGAWLIMGIGLCAVLMSTAALTARRQRRTVLR